MCGCSYTRIPAADTPPASQRLRATDTLPLRWPRNWTQGLPETTIVEGVATSSETSGGEAGRMAARITQLRSVRSAHGLITYRKAVPLWRQQDGELGFEVPPDVSSSQPLVTTFEYYAWREQPLMSEFPDEACATSQEQRAWLHALTASAPFHMQFTVWMPPGKTARGLVLYHWGLSGYRFERQLVEALTGRGWAVLCHNGLTWSRPGALRVSPGAPAPSPEPSAQSEPQQPLEREKAAPPEDSIEPAAALAAADFDDAMGQYALATQDAMEFVRDQIPSVPSHPRVLVGCSFGAIMSPTVAARVGPSVDACVLIGGGANFLEIAGSDWIDYYYSRVRGKPSGGMHMPVALRKHVTKAYLEKATLDAYNTAPLLAGTPVLVLHALYDRIVPADNGDLLWERLGRPERWVGSFGHLMMFATLSWHVDEIVDWIDRALSQEPRY